MKHQQVPIDNINKNIKNIKNKNPNMDNKNYIVVFDMDETLGHFEELSIFWSAIKSYSISKNHKTLKIEELYRLIDLFPKFLRPNILKILEYLKNKKQKGICDKVMIYTNNQSKSWPELIRSYFDYKMNYPLFDQTIRAFKLHGKLIEVCRTSHDKSVRDLINCTKLPPNTQICFIDDLYHPEMEHPNVVYLHIKAYTYNIPYDKMIAVYYDKNKDKIGDKEDFV
ncbi:unnamed protein product, partial [marine sediment metagenome]